MKTIVLQDHKIYSERYEKGKLEEVTSLLSFLNSTIEVRGNFLFKDLIELIKNEIDQYDLLFKDALGGHCLKPFIEEFDKDLVFDKDREIKYLEVAWETDLVSDNINSFSVEAYFNGRGDEGSYGLDFTPLNNLKNFEIKINNCVELVNIETEEIICKVDIPFTVSKFVSAILYEISFYGYPEERDQQLKSLSLRIEDLENEETRNKKSGI